MKPTSVVTAALMGLAVYLLLQFVFGMYGLVAHTVVSDYLDRSRDTLVRVRERREELQREVEALTGDAETIRIEARRIGIVASDEVVVRVDGRDRRPRYRYSSGEQPLEVPWPRDNRPLFRAVGFATTLLVLLVYLLGSPPPRRRPARDEEWEIEITER